MTSIEYANSYDDAFDRLMGRVIGFGAIAYSVTPILSSGLAQAMQEGWLESPPNTSWDQLSSPDAVLHLFASLRAYGAVVIGGGLILRRISVGFTLVRCGVVVLIVLRLILQARAFQRPEIAQLWSTLGGALAHSTYFLDRLWLPIFLAGLTLPAIARRLAWRPIADASSGDA